MEYGLRSVLDIQLNFLRDIISAKQRFRPAPQSARPPSAWKTPAGTVMAGNPASVARMPLRSA